MRILASDTVKQIGKTVTLFGWINSRRDHGKIVFLDLRDRSGLVQVVGTKDLVGKVGPEDVVRIEGMVKPRPPALVNPKIASGTVEVETQKVEPITNASELPFPIDTDGYDINEEIRSKFRYLDLRRPRMTRNLRLRSQVTTFTRNFLTKRDFVEVETPILTKTTPEGARDFIVPSRLQPGKFYALPQSPQQYKQMLMVAGLERYFQIARCFRDEDPRADRAYGEFTQLDMEMSFITQDDILKLTEELFTQIVKEIFPEKRIKEIPFPRIPHVEAKLRFGTDKPDLRENKSDPNELAFSWTIDFPLFKEQSEEDFYFGSGKAKFAPSHHMFTAPYPDDIKLLDSDPMKVRGLQHDLVLNGYEIGGGSIRIHDPIVQAKVFELIGFTEKQKEQFAHMLTAFTFGVPPHGGIAPGIDRFLMAVLSEPSVREVMAFPTSASGQTSVMDAPSFITEEQLEELSMQIVTEKGDVHMRLVKLLQKQQIKYETYEHKPVFTSEEAARVRNTRLEEGAKALVMFADKEPLMVVVPANLKVDSKAFKKLFGVKDLAMATKEQVRQVTGVEIGAVPPFGNLFDLPTYIDEKLKLNESIVFSAGRHTHSVRLREADFEKLVKPILGSFTK